MDYKSRVAERHLAAVIGVQPVAILMGARQSGKSTLVRRHPLLQQHLYLSLDSTEVREQAVQDPESLVRRAHALILDEVQRVPDLLLAIKQIVDTEEREPGRFVLTGSADILAMRPAGETLAGRASYTTLWPLTRRERLGLGEAGIWTRLADHSVSTWPELLEAQTAPADDWRAVVRRSAYPVPAFRLTTLEEQAVWLDGYVDTYIDRDVTALAAISKPLDLRRLMRAVCTSLGQVENQAEWGRFIGMPRSTVSRYLDLLELSYQLIRVPAYAVNRTKRLAKSPKVYWSDPALALHLIGSGEPTGFHLENLIAVDLIAWSWSEPRRPAILHWRTQDRLEVDFVIEFADGRVMPIEVKSAERPGWREASGVRAFLDEYGDAAIGGLVLHGGSDVYPIAPRIIAAPWWRVI